ncbi:GNAT family N-acetyltransferase [Chitinimonas naiadis]
MSSHAAIALRRARPEDRAALYAICLATGDAGKDASLPGRQGELYGHIYAGPYLALAPEFAWVVEDAQGVCGYALAVADSRHFYDRMETAWLPLLRQQYITARIPADQWLIDRLQTPFALDPQLADWPAHLHIDLLDRAQGLGLGSRLMQALLDDLKTAEVPAVHLGVDPRNARALAWYTRQGFGTLFTQPGCVWLGKYLQESGSVHNKPSDLGIQAPR